MKITERSKSKRGAGDYRGDEAHLEVKEGQVHWLQKENHGDDTASFYLMTPPKTAGEFESWRKNLETTTVGFFYSRLGVIIGPKPMVLKKTIGYV